MIESIKVSASFEEFCQLTNIDLAKTKKQMKAKMRRSNEKTTLAFVYKPKSSVCLKIDAKEVAEKLGLDEYIGVSYFPEDKCFMISGNYSTNDILYPIYYSVSEKKYRCYQKELVIELTSAACITFDDNVTTISFHNVTIQEHPKLGKVALIYTDEE